MLMQLAIQNGMVVHQMDVKTAYLNAPIDCELYIGQPEGYERKGSNGEKLVCELKKSHRLKKGVSVSVFVTVI